MSETSEREAAINKRRQSGYYAEGGDMAWLLDELLEWKQGFGKATDAIQKLQNELAAAHKREGKLREALRDACDVAVWLTGMPIPDEAQQCWQDEMRPKLHAAMDLLGPDAALSEGEG